MTPCHYPPNPDISNQVKLRCFRFDKADGKEEGCSRLSRTIAVCQTKNASQQDRRPVCVICQRQSQQDEGRRPVLGTISRDNIFFLKSVDNLYGYHNKETGYIMTAGQKGVIVKVVPVAHADDTPHATSLNHQWISVEKGA
ncbi:hypothetical protein NXS19_014146 [Fusarium pseudograminearum]|nr:hypothetical protein NXS19_014146 [Fusarium pseudograminearum]